MKIFNTISEIKQHLKELKKDGKSIGFVPTMGALHQGHLELVTKARAENDICVCSIFVNPIQFNNKEDLKKYPNEIEKDVTLLESEHCDVLFNPSVEEMYPEPDNTVFDFGNLESVMEGKNRPGHFRGVAVVVKKLFEIIEPTNAYFGKKDYQQLLIVKSLVEQYKLSPEIIACDTVREESGLAKSSRNAHLDFWQIREAAFLFETLNKGKELKEYLSPDQIIKWVMERFKGKETFILEYFEVADGINLKPINDWNESSRPMAFIVAQMGSVRLIDNIELY